MHFIYVMDKPVLIIGANSVGKSALEIFNSNNVVVYGFLDDKKANHGKEINEVTVLGSSDDENYLKIIGKECEVFIASDDVKERKYLVEHINKERSAMPVNAIHKSANLASNVELKHGNFINAGSYIGPFSKIGGHNIINAAVIIENEVTIGDYNQIGAGAIINSDVTIEDNVFVGSGAIIISGVTLKKGARIGAGSMVMADVHKNETVFGNPAQPVKN